MHMGKSLGKLYGEHPRPPRCLLDVLCSKEDKEGRNRREDGRSRKIVHFGWHHQTKTIITCSQPAVGRCRGFQICEHLFRVTGACGGFAAIERFCCYSTPVLAFENLLKENGLGVARP